MRQILWLLAAVSVLVGCSIDQPGADDDGSTGARGDVDAGVVQPDVGEDLAACRDLVCWMVAAKDGRDQSVVVPAKRKCLRDVHDNGLTEYEELETYCIEGVSGGEWLGAEDCRVEMRGECDEAHPGDTDNVRRCQGAVCQVVVEGAGAETAAEISEVWDRCMNDLQEKRIRSRSGLLGFCLDEGGSEGSCQNYLSSCDEIPE